MAFMAKAPGRWNLADATKRINACAASDDLTLSWQEHAKERLRERDLIMSDAMHILKRGFVLNEPEPATRDGYFKYRIEGTTPNSDGRTVALVVIPDGANELKIVTIMWRDER